VCGSLRQRHEGTRSTVVLGGDAGCPVAEGQQSQWEARSGPVFATDATIGRTGQTGWTVTVLDGAAPQAGEGPTMTAEERPIRELGRDVAGTGRLVYVAGVVVLTEPGPAAAGLVVTDQQERMLAQRAHYLGPATRLQAAAQALLGAARLAFDGGLTAPVFRIDDAELARRADPAAPIVAPAGDPDGTWRALRATLERLPGYRVEVIPPRANRAGAVALTPLVDWLPERDRRGEGLVVHALGDGRYEVESESEPGRTYHVTFRPQDASEAGATCECADFLYRGIPCKHLFAVARETHNLDRLFHIPRRP
jgi:hypothetical protein